MSVHEYFAGWGDVDFNLHMKNYCYLEKAGDARMITFTEKGFSIKRFFEMKFGPVVLSDKIEYFSEILLYEKFHVSTEVTGLSVDGSRLAMKNTFFKAGGKTSAIVTSTGGWIDIKSRKLAPPPPELYDVLSSMERSADFSELEAIKK